MLTTSWSCAVMRLPRRWEARDPGRRLPVQEPGAAAGTFTWLVDRPSKRQRGGRDAAKPLVRNGLGRWLDLTKRPGMPDTVEQGVHAPAYLGRQVNAGAAANALLLLSARPSRGRSRGEAVGVRHRLLGCRYLPRRSPSAGIAANGIFPARNQSEHALAGPGELILRLVPDH